MSDSPEEEYVVEYIKMAKVVTKRGKNITWHYLVKWEGYNKPEDDTWEPKESFEGAEHFIEKFWKRCRPDRDIDDPTAWNKGEEVIPVGPPRRAPKRPTSKAKEPLSPAKPPKRRVEEKDKQKKRKKVNHVSDSAPPAKRLRSKVILDSPEMNLGESASMVVDDFDASADGSAAGSNFNPLFDGSPGPGSPSPVKSSSVRKPPSQQKGKELQPSPVKPVEKNKKDLQAVISSIGGSHRKRAQNPLVRMHEEPQVDVTNGIRTKTRLLARNANAASAGGPSQASPPDAGAEKQPTSNPPKLSVHAPPMPGRRKVSTRGSSLLMFNKDGPVTLRREPKRSEPAATSVVDDDNSKQLSPESSNAIIPDSTEATPDLEEGAPILETPAADLPPTPVSPVQRARQLQETVKGLIPDASELPEFEEETQVEESVVVTTSGPKTSGDVETITVKEIITTTTTTEAPTPTGLGFLQRIESGLGSLFGRRAMPPTAATGQASVSPIKIKPSFAKHNTIFGVLSGSGSAVKQDSTTAFIKLDTNISIPITLNEHRPPQSDDWPKTEDTIELGHTIRSEPGKFYPPEVLKPVLKVGGPSALVSVHTSATEAQQADFAKFVGRLTQENGFVFLASYGRETCLFATSENLSVAEAFEIPASLTGVPEQVVVSRVDLPDTMAYLDATAHAKSW